jgi:hypothetical protein
VSLTHDPKQLMKYWVHQVVPHGEPHLHFVPLPTTQAPASPAGNRRVSSASPNLAAIALMYYLLVNARDYASLLT